MSKRKLTLAERKKIQDELPISISYGYDLILEKMLEKGIEISRNKISQAFTIENRFNADVMDAAFEVILDVTNKVEGQRKQLQEL